MKSILFAALVSLWVFPQISFAQASKELNGTWQGSMSMQSDTCGFQHQTEYFRHTIEAPFSSRVLRLFVRDEDNRLTMAQFPYIGVTATGITFRSVSEAFNWNSTYYAAMAYEYSRLKNDRASMRQIVELYNRRTGQLRCRVVYAGAAQRTQKPYYNF